MQNLWMLVGGLGCLLLTLMIYWRTPPVQDEDLQARETDLDDD